MLECGFVLGPGFGRALGARVEGCARAWQPRHVSVRSHTPNSKHSLPPCAHAATLPPAAFAVPAAGAFALAAAAPVAALATLAAAALARALAAPPAGALAAPPAAPPALPATPAGNSRVR